MIRIKKKTANNGKWRFVIWIAVACILPIGSYAALLCWKSRPFLKHMPQTEARVELVDDPVCGMTIKPPAAGHAEYRGKLYYFCSPGCKKDFEKNPGKYIHNKEAKKTKAD